MQGTTAPTYHGNVGKDKQKHLTRNVWKQNTQVSTSAAHGLEKIVKTFDEQCNVHTDSTLQ